MSYDLLIVTGAPGAGKTSVAQALVDLGSDFVVFDIDWLAEPVSMLTGRDIHTDASAWVAYGKLWFEILHSVSRNGCQPLFFCPNTPADFERQQLATWYNTCHWLLLDCDDAVRTARLDARADWSDERKQEALDDAAELREAVPERIDTSGTTPEEAAHLVLAWASRW